MAHGYSAVGGGKIYHGAFPDPPSWQSYFPSERKNKPDDPMPPNRPLNGIPKTAHFDWGPVDVPDRQMGDRQVAKWAIGQLRKKHEKPFFIACGFFRPHLPWYVPTKYFDMYPPDKITLPNVNENDLDDVPELGKRMAKPQGDHAKVIKHKQWRKAVQGYLASITFVDTCVGRVIKALDRSTYADNTIVILWSDHGWHLGEKLHWRKFSLWEEATHNVLMAVVPGVTKPGRRCSRPVTMVDIYPTLIDLCGLTPKDELEGRSLVPLLKNPKAKWERPALTTHGRNNHSLRGERFRYIRYSDGTEELYDHEKDALEWINLADDPKYAEVRKELAKWLPKKNVPDVPRRKAKKNTSKTKE
jgi:arylsulfatase A-like enzyme